MPAEQIGSTLFRFAVLAFIAFDSHLCATVVVRGDGSITTSRGSMQKVDTQFIAALGDPKSSRGKGAETWGLWRVDPGPRGVRLAHWRQLEAGNGIAPAGWKFDRKDWWLEEHGLIMEKPEPLPAGKYMVTGGRETTALLSVNDDGSWELSKGTLEDVTHLPCRSAKYVPIEDSDTGNPGNANIADFPVTPGGTMPDVAGCKRQDYWVVFVIAVGK